MSDDASTIPRVSNHQNFRKKESNIKIQENKEGTTMITNITEEDVIDANSLLEVIQKANKNRTVGSTGMNEESSRSHFLIRLKIRKRMNNRFSDDKENECDNEYNKEVTTTEGTLYLVDLAGSESVKHTNSRGKRQQEGGKINQRCVNIVLFSDMNTSIPFFLVSILSLILCIPYHFQPIDSFKSDKKP